MNARGAAALATFALACGLPEPGPFARVTGASPEGEGVSVRVSPEIRFSAAVSPEGLVNGRRLVLAETSALKETIAAVESDAGASGAGVAVGVTLEDGACRVVLRPQAPLRSFTGHVLVLSSRASAADGGPVLDPDGRRRTFVASFETGAGDGPPPVPALTEVRADAATPEAGGEYVEVANLGQGLLDVGGFRLAKRTATGALSSCAISAPTGGAVLAPGAVALVAGGAYDGRYALPAGVAVLACGATALLGGIANDRAPEILLLDRAGTTVATLGANGGRICAVALEKLDPMAIDTPANLACTAGSPGRLP